MFKLLGKVVLCVGEKHIVQVVTDSASANDLAGKSCTRAQPTMICSVEKLATLQPGVAFSLPYG